MRKYRQKYVQSPIFSGWAQSMHWHAGFLVHPWKKHWVVAQKIHIQLCIFLPTVSNYVNIKSLVVILFEIFFLFRVVLKLRCGPCLLTIWPWPTHHKGVRPTFLNRTGKFLLSVLSWYIYHIWIYGYFRL